MSNSLRFTRASMLAAALLSVWLHAGCAAPEGPQKLTDVSGVKNLRQDGRLYVAGTPTPEGLDELNARGVKTVIDLRRADELRGDEAETARRRGMAYYHLPMQSDQLTDEQAAEFLKIMREHDNEPVLMHCAGGSRAGAMYGLYLGATEKCPIDEAIHRARAAGLRNNTLESDMVKALNQQEAAK